MDTYLSIEVLVSEGDEVRSLHKKNLVKAKEDIMFMLQRMMKHPERYPDMKVKILQTRMNMF